jgi:hypothetical protein
MDNSHLADNSNSGRSSSSSDGSSNSSGDGIGDVILLSYRYRWSQSIASWYPYNTPKFCLLEVYNVNHLSFPLYINP